jgi:hypothetical protein
VRLARELGISVKRLTGWEPTETVRAVYEDTDPTDPAGSGRLLAGFEVIREPEWDDEQVALFLALDETEEETGSHGIPMTEATSALADPTNRYVGYHYDVPPPRIDHAQRALNLAQSQRREAYPEEDAGSLLWTLTRVEDGPPTTPEQ